MLAVAPLPIAGKTASGQSQRAPTLSELYAQDHVALSGRTFDVIDRNNEAQKNTVVIFPHILVAEPVLIYDKDSNRYLAFSVPPHNADNGVLSDLINHADPNPGFNRFCEVVVVNEEDREDKYQGQVEQANFNVKNLVKLNIFPVGANRSQMSPRTIVFVPEANKLYVYRSEGDGQLIAVHDDVFKGNRGPGS